MKYYVASDVHGFYGLLRESLETAGYFEDTGAHRLLLLGDLFDRGGEALRMQEFVLELLEKDEVTLVRGNHEDLFRALATTDFGIPYRHHLHNGTYDTALQLTGFDPEKSRERHVEFSRLMRKTPYYKTIIPAMRDWFETEHYIFVHGWIPCEKESGGYVYRPDWREATPEQWQAARWINGMEAAATAREEDKVIVCGHWHCSWGHAAYENEGTEFGPDADFSPFFGPGVLAIDACTAYSNRVNVVVLEDDACR